MRFPTLLTVFLAFAAFPAVPAAAEAPLRLISVTAEGRVEAPPDMAVITIGATTEAESAAAALSANSEQMARVLEYLRGQGIADRDLQTTGLSLSPRYDSASYGGNAPPVVNGFIATNGVTARVRALESLGGLLDAVVAEGANTLYGVSFALQNPEPMADEARAKAVAEARRRAEIYAAAAGVTLGRIASITEPGGFAGPMPMGASFAKEMGVPVAPGEVSVAAQVTAVFEIAE